MSSTPNNDFSVRAYMLLNTLDYFRQTPELEGLIEKVSPKTMEMADKLKMADWCPGPTFVELLRLIAQSANGDEKLAQERLIKQGIFVSRTATNTFLRLLMKMLTPTTFAKKLPEFWKRDCTLGRYEVEVDSPTITCRLMDMEGFDHIACTGAGFVINTFEGMGKKIEKTEIKGWSLDKPYTNGCSFELTWTP